MEPDDPVPIADSLDAVIRSMRGPSRAVVGGVFGRWDEIVGASISAHVRPVQLDQAVLVVQVDEPGWATEMKFLSPQLIAQIQAAIGITIDRIEVRVDARNARGQRGFRPERRSGRRG